MTIQWVTQAGNLGTFDDKVTLTTQVFAQVSSPATTIAYKIHGGDFPSTLTLDVDTGVISGIPMTHVSKTHLFVVRATDDLGNSKDRTFSITIVNDDIPEFVTPNGLLLTTQDSIWTEHIIEFTGQATMRLYTGELPPGLGINENGVLRGYPSPPTLGITAIAASAITTEIADNVIICNSTGFTPGRIVTFSGTIFGGVEINRRYYVKEVKTANSFTLSASIDGPELELSDGTGFMAIQFPATTSTQPALRTYNFTLVVENEFGENYRDFSITVINQNAPVNEGGPGKPTNSREPVILNTRPESFFLDNNLYFGYYLLPNDSGLTYPPAQEAPIGLIDSGDTFAFKIIGYDFDDSVIEYVYSGLPSGLTGNSTTGWITGTLNVSENVLSKFEFTAQVRKANNPTFQSPVFTFSLLVTNGVSTRIDWISPSNLGTINNGADSSLVIQADSDTPIQYRIIAGSLPPTLELTNSGDIVGTVVYQPISVFSPEGTQNTFNFTVQAFSPDHPLVLSTKEFSITIEQTYADPTDTLYVKCSPSIKDRDFIIDLLADETIIPSDVIYRPLDANFGKASEVSYVHAFGIDSNTINEYLNAITINHYWRNVTLGSLHTAVARDENNEIIYEVVYSKIIDNLLNPQGTSVSKEVVWPRQIKWNDQAGLPQTTRRVYPNSIPNMRTQVADVLGQQLNYPLYPKWMVSQQENGSTLGFTLAWVICYTKPGYSQTVKQNIDTLWVNRFGNRNTLNQVNFTIDRFLVDKSNTYNFEANFDPRAWTGYPSATPKADPANTYDFPVLFPRKTILPNQTNN